MTPVFLIRSSISGPLRQSGLAVQHPPADGRTDRALGGDGGKNGLRARIVKTTNQPQSETTLFLPATPRGRSDFSGPGLRRFRNRAVDVQRPISGSAAVDFAFGALNSTY